jgi:hypothetical protein
MKIAAVPSSFRPAKAALAWRCLVASRLFLFRPADASASGSEKPLGGVFPLQRVRLFVAPGNRPIKHLLNHCCSVRRGCSAAMPELPEPRRNLLCFSYLSQQCIHGIVESFISDIPESDDTILIQYIYRRPGTHVPLAGNGTQLAAAVPPGRPCHFFFFDYLAQAVFGIAVNSEECKRLALHSLHERPLVWVQIPAWSSPVAPEIQHHHFSAVFA